MVIDASMFCRIRRVREGNRGFIDEDTLPDNMADNATTVGDLEYDDYADNVDTGNDVGDDAEDEVEDENVDEEYHEIERDEMIVERPRRQCRKLCYLSDYV